MKPACIISNVFITVLILGSISFAYPQQTSDSSRRVLIDQDFKKGEAKQVKLLVNIRNGIFNLKGDYKHLANVKFDYLNKNWEPSASYIEEDGTGKLIIKAPAEFDINSKEITNTCAVLLNKNLQYTLGLELTAGMADIDLAGYNIQKALLRFGAGQFNINLANTAVQSLKIEAGAGEATIDLSGKRTVPFIADIKAGVGQITIIVPENANVMFEISGFLGSVDAGGFNKKGNIYTNKPTNNESTTMSFKIVGAIGNVIIRQK